MITRSFRFWPAPSFSHFESLSFIAPDGISPSHPSVSLHTVSFNTLTSACKYMLQVSSFMLFNRNECQNKTLNSFCVYVLHLEDLLWIKISMKLSAQLSLSSLKEQNTNALIRSKHKIWKRKINFQLNWVLIQLVRLVCSTSKRISMILLSHAPKSRLWKQPIDLKGLRKLTKTWRRSSRSVWRKEDYVKSSELSMLVPLALLNLNFIQSFDGRAGQEARTS